MTPMPDAAVPITNGKRMRRVLGMGMSLPAAEFISYWGNWLLVAALVIGVIATYGVVVAGNVKDAYLKRDLAESAERTATLELKAEQLRRLAGPRSIDRTAFLKELEGKPKSPVQIWYLPDVPDGVWLMNQVVSSVIEARWDLVEPPTPIAPNPALPAHDAARFLPPLMAMGAQPVGVSVLAHGVPADIDKEHPSLDALVAALAKGMGSGAAGGFSLSVPEGVLRIVIAAKPDPILPPDTKPRP